jgi:hypothetical protein
LLLCQRHEHSREPYVLAIFIMGLEPNDTPGRDQKSKLAAAPSDADLSHLAPSTEGKMQELISAIATAAASSNQELFTFLRRLITSSVDDYRELVTLLSPEDSPSNACLMAAHIVALEHDIVFAGELYKSFPFNPKKLGSTAEMRRAANVISRLGTFEEMRDVFQRLLKCVCETGAITHLVDTLYFASQGFGIPSTKSLWNEALALLPYDLSSSYTKWLKGPPVCTTDYQTHLNPPIKAGDTTQQSPSQTTHISVAIERLDELAQLGRFPEAVRGFEQLLKEHPTLTKAAQRFCDRNSIPENHSRNLLRAVGQSLAKRKREQPGAFPKVYLDREVSIHGRCKTIRAWLKEANALTVSHPLSGAAEGVVDIWMSIVHEFPSTTPFFKTQLQGLLQRIEPTRWLTALQVSERCQRGGAVVNLLTSVARAGVQEGRPIARQLFEELLSSAPSSGIRKTYSHALIKGGDLSGAIALWKDLPPSEGYATLVFVEEAQAANSKIAVHLNTIIDQIVGSNPMACVAMAYRQMALWPSPPLARELLTRLIERQAGSLTENDRTAICLMLEHRGIKAAHKAQMLDNLRGEGKLSHEEYDSLLSEFHIQPHNQAILQRDSEIEEYLNRAMPTLKTGTFFRELSERQPHLNPGKKTSRMARSVLFKTNRMTQNNTRPGQKRRES